MCEPIDVDDPDVLCTGVRHCVRIDRPMSPRHRKRDPVTISLLDSDSEDTKVARLPHPRSSVPLTELQRITQSELASRCERRFATDPINDHPDLKRKARARSPEIIEISSDSEDERWPSKRQKVDPYRAISRDSPDIPKIEPTLSRAEFHSPSPSDHSFSDADDDDCIDFLAALDISNESSWVPLPERNKAEDLTPLYETDMKPPRLQPSPPFRVSRKMPPFDCYHDPDPGWLSASLWETLSRNHGITRFPKPFYRARRQERLFPCRSPSLHFEKGYTKLELTAKYPHLMSGSVNKIIQGQDTTIICAVVEGGLEESDDDDDDNDDRPPPPPENRLGSLVVHRHGRVHVERAHFHPRRTSRGSVMKYYSVNDVAFNPLNPRQFLSSGHDLSVQMWEILDHSDGDGRMSLSAIRNLTFPSRPHDLVYAPDGSALAITCYDGTVRLYFQDLFEDMLDVDVPSKKFQVGPKGFDHATGSTIWGKGPSNHLLFSSSEPKKRDDWSGFHFAFDTRKGTQAVQFDATESGDAATLSPDGATLVLFTSAKDGIHPVRLYDVRRKAKAAYETEELERFKVRPVGCNQEPGDFLGEVNQASFSPDGCLLAVARNDNTLHVYDVRALSRGPLCRFEHHDSDAVGGGGFGIVATNWIQGRDRIGIVSGGNDGCVRLWEPMLGSTNEDVQGVVLGRTDFDVGHFSIGNPQSGELPLVIGDSGGGVHTYDFTNGDGIRI